MGFSDFVPVASTETPFRHQGGEGIGPNAYDRPASRNQIRGDRARAAERNDAVAHCISNDLV